MTAAPRLTFRAVAVDTDGRERPAVATVAVDDRYRPATLVALSSPAGTPIPLPSEGLYLDPLIRPEGR